MVILWYYNGIIIEGETTLLVFYHYTRSIQKRARKIPHGQGKKLGGVGKHKLWIGRHFCYCFFDMAISNLLAIIFSVLTFLFPSSLVVLLFLPMCIMKNCNSCLRMDSTFFYIFYRLNCIFL